MSDIGVFVPSPGPSSDSAHGWPSSAPLQAGHDAGAIPAPDVLGRVSESLSADGKLPAVMAAWIDLAADELTRAEAPLEPASARRVAVRVVARLCSEYGGTYSYIPKGDALERAIRDATIWADYDYTTDGLRGVRAMARRHGLTEIHIYRILERQRQLHLARIPVR